MVMLEQHVMDMDTLIMIPEDCLKEAVTVEQMNILARLAPLLSELYVPLEKLSSEKTWRRLTQVRLVAGGVVTRGGQGGACRLTLVRVRKTEERALLRERKLCGGGEGKTPQREARG